MKTITKYRVYFNSERKELGYIEYPSSEGLDQFETITEEISDDEIISTNGN
ncbi:hypothetical protein OX284_004930 [Flavobacterium sp. SUN046]|uniref:hypothetical protein n=1 Tax=Flavobacterium sp. SUN046 TaxID=3002440 RepID=UPI002DBEF6B8|nr:hypothetical protein [Flavobacterium sp. SUN046]MEC4048765.1 hypothetical protein [Flavobacterium sp. SUN046]